MDRISELPDGLIHRILSRIHMTDVVKTCILSKRWRYIWTSVNTVTIAFNSPEFEKYPIIERITRFIDFVDKILNLRDVVADINEFRLTFHLSEEDDEGLESPDYFDTLASRLNVWISSVVRRNIKTLHIQFFVDEELTFELPESLFNCKTLVSLSLEMRDRYCSQIVVPNSCCLPRLRSLELEGLSFENPGAATRLISSCPVLESLALYGIQIDNHQDFIIDSSTLKNFVLINGDWQESLMAKTIKLNAPKLKSFRCSDFMTQEFSLTNLSSLVDADVTMLMREVETNTQYPELYLELSGEDKDKYGKCLLNLLGALRNVKELELNEAILEVASGSLDLGTQLPQFCNLRCLKLYFWLTRGCLRSIVYLLTISPNIESLQLGLNSFADYPLPPQFGIPDEDRLSLLVKAGDDWKSGLPLTCTLLHLKHFTIVGIKGEDNELELVEFLLKNAVVLEELGLLSYIGNISDDRKRQMNSYCEKLKTLPRASSRLTIKFENLNPTKEGRQIQTWPIA